MPGPDTIDAVAVCEPASIVPLIAFTVIVSTWFVPTGLSAVAGVIWMFAFGPATQMSAPSWGVDSDENGPSAYPPPLAVITCVPSPPSLVTSMLPAPADVTSAAENFPIWWFVTASIHASKSDPPELPNVHGFAGTTSRSSGNLTGLTTVFTVDAVIATTLFATFIFTKWFGRLIGVDRKLAELIAAGTSICGASAVIATNTVTEAHDEDVAYAVACVTVFGSLAMFLYPALPGVLHLDTRAFGLWSGASIHEIAQVVAAAFQVGKESGEYGTIAKLTRVTMLAPLVIGLGLLASHRQRRHRQESTRMRVPAPAPVQPQQT